MATKKTTSAPKDRSNVKPIKPVVPTGSRLARQFAAFENWTIPASNNINQAVDRALNSDILSFLRLGAKAVKYELSNPDNGPKKVYTGHPSMNAKISSAPATSPQPAIEEYTAAYKWNLPPHEWSLPFGPDKLQPDVVKPFADDVHSTRRGRIFYSQGFTGPSITKDKGGNWVQDNLSDSYYGFQFMWNPDSFTQTTSVNMNVTPSETDPLANLTGFFAANSHLDFTIRLDRTNDFACFKAIDLKYKAVTAPNRIGAVKDVTEFIKYYEKGKPRLSDNDFGINIESKIRNLLTYGTMADLEFLYRTINGGGFKSFGVETSNIGYLRPTIVRIDLGPQKFLGVIGSLSLNHISFTKDMVPIRTDVTISIDLRALTSYSTNKSIGNSVPRSSTPGANK